MSWKLWAAPCAALMTLIVPALAQVEAGPKEPTITVTGTGEVKARPDVAYVTLGVVTQGKRAQEASQANAAAAQKIMEALRAQGIAEKDLQTSSYNVQPMYEAPRPGEQREPRITGYQVSNQVRATVRDLRKVGGVIDAALDAGANSVQGVGFGLENDDEQETAALTAAVSEARRKADALAKAAGERVGRVLRIQESGFVRPVPMFRGEMAMARAADTPISPGELTVSANVTVIYLLEGRAVGRAPSSTERRLLARREGLMLETLRLERMYSEKHPALASARREMAALDRQLAGLRRGANETGAKRNE